MNEQVMNNISGGIWGSYPPSKKEKTMITDRCLSDRKERYLKFIMGELEAYVERPSEEWEKNEEDAILDMLGAVENTVKAQLSSNDPQYTG